QRGASQRRFAHQVRRQCCRVAQCKIRAHWYTYFRSRNSRVTYREVHENRVVGARSPIGAKAMRKIRKGDEVIVLAGRDKSRRGTVLSVQGDRVVVEGINIAKKHVRPNPMAGVQGGIIDKTMPIHISNVALYNPETGKGDRVGIDVVDGRKVRVFRSTGKVVGAKA